MELEEAIKYLKSLKNPFDLSNRLKYSKAIKTALQALENWIPKKKIEDKIKQCQDYFKTTYVPNCDGLVFKRQQEKYLPIIIERERKIVQIKILQELLEDK